LLSHTRAAGRGRAGDRGAATRARVGRRHRHGAQAARVVLSGRGVPPRLLPSQPEPGVLQRGDRAQGGEGPEALSGQVETAGVSAPVKYVLYGAVRLFGGLAWVRNRADRAAGFDRVLADVRLKASTLSQRQGTLRRLANHAWRRFGSRRST